MVLLDVRGNLTVAVAEFALEELDMALQARLSDSMRQPPALTLRRQHLHELAPAQHERLQLLQLGVGQRLDEAVTLGMLMPHPGKRGKHSGIDRVRLRQGTHRSSEVTGGSRVHHGDHQSRGLQRAGRLELITARRLQDDQLGFERNQLLGELLDPVNVVRHLPGGMLPAACDLQGLTGDVDANESQIGHVPSLPSLSMRTSSSYNRSGCKKGRSNSCAQSSEAG